MSTPALETLTPTAANAWRIDVDTSATETPEYVQVRGVSSFTPGVNDTVQDASDYDAEGWGSDAVTLQKWSNTLTVLRKVNTDDAYDPGQEALRVAANTKELVKVRWYDRTAATAEAYEGHALVQWNPAGGDVTALQTVNVTLLGQGARTAITNPTTTP